MYSKVNIMYLSVYYLCALKPQGVEYFSRKKPHGQHMALCDFFDISWLMSQ